MLTATYMNVLLLIPTFISASGIDDSTPTVPIQLPWNTELNSGVISYYKDVIKRKSEVFPKFIFMAYLSKSEENQSNVENMILKMKFYANNLRLINTNFSDYTLRVKEVIDSLLNDSVVEAAFPIEFCILQHIAKKMTVPSLPTPNCTLKKHFEFIQFKLEIVDFFNLLYSKMITYTIFSQYVNAIETSSCFLSYSHDYIFSERVNVEVALNRLISRLCHLLIDVSGHLPRFKRLSMNVKRKKQELLSNLINTVREQINTINMPVNTFVDADLVVKYLKLITDCHNIYQSILKVHRLIYNEEFVDKSTISSEFISLYYHYKGIYIFYNDTSNHMLFKQMLNLTQELYNSVIYGFQHVVIYALNVHKVATALLTKMSEITQIPVCQVVSSEIDV
ncbi:hypothetical protein THOM_3055 [Trachipleistophora hominis]|uniref:Uncharacterized protein n=1 Tax=Trachipleistophora hominis TaxID=72359 RepID=L7JTD7_TRAHO|nr:hypothetical protein THOM_3055 [Trachipleistophora hominis]